MAKDVITRFKLETTQYDSMMRSAVKELSDFAKTATQAGSNFNNFTKKQVEAARAIGNMETTCTDAKGKVKELVSSFNDFARSYNALNEQQKQGDFAKAMAESLTTLQGRIKQAKAEMQGLSAPGAQGGGGFFSNLGGKIESKMDGMLAVAGGNLYTKAAAQAANLASKVGEVVMESVQLAKEGEGIRIAFERLGRGDLLDGLRKATHGTVTDIELMKAAVKFNDFNLPVEELGTMLAFAQQKAKDTGQSVDYMVDSIVTGLGRKSLPILDNLGLSSTEIKEEMKKTGDMTTAVGAIIRKQMSEAGEYIETAADKAAQADVELKNAMEDLGRTFGPIMENGGNMWKSLEVGAIKLLNNAVKPLIENLTYAGRLKAQLDKMNGGGNGRPSEVQKQLRFLQKTSAGNRQTRYEKQLGIYAQAEEQEWRRVNAKRNQLNAAKAAIAKTTPSGTLADASESQKEYLKRLEQSLNISIAKAKEWGNITKQYKEGAKAILNPVKETVDDTIKGVDELKKKLIDLQAERKKVAAGSDEAKRLDAEIRQVKADIKLQDPNYFKTTTTHTLTKPEQASEKYEQAQKDYNQALAQAALEVKAGMISEQEAKKKELSAAETLWKSIGDAREVYDSPKLKEAQENVEKTFIELGQSIKASSVTWETGLSGFNAQTMQAWMTGRQSDLSKAEIGSSEYSGIMSNIADMNTIKTILEQSMKAGIDSAQFNLEPLWEKVFDGENIDDKVWQDMVDVINAKLAEMHLDPITLDFNTGNVKKETKEVNKEWNAAASAIQAVGNAMSQIEDPAAKVMGTIAQAVATMALSYAQAASATSYQGWGWIAFAATGLATMLSSISAIKQATSGFANGGVIPGNSMSGDNLRGMTPDGTVYGLNSQEIILNKAQQGNLASQLSESAVQGFGGQPYVEGEKIFLGMNNSSRRMGRGEIVTTQTLRRMGLTR